jgi:hypothetical protein
MQLRDSSKPSLHHAGFPQVLGRQHYHPKLVFGPDHRAVQYAEECARRDIDADLDVGRSLTSLLQSEPEDRLVVPMQTWRHRQPQVSGSPYPPRRLTSIANLALSPDDKARLLTSGNVDLHSLSSAQLPRSLTRSTPAAAWYRRAGTATRRARTRHLEAVVNDESPCPRTSAGPTCRSLRARLEARTLASMTVCDRGSADTLLRALAGLLEGYVNVRL